MRPKRTFTGTADRTVGTEQCGLLAQVSGADVLGHVVLLAHVVAGCVGTNSVRSCLSILKPVYYGHLTRKKHLIQPK
jgi:hypothetical protein